MCHCANVRDLMQYIIIIINLYLIDTMSIANLRSKK